MQNFKLVTCVPQQMDPQPLTLPQNPSVVLETCREQRKLISMLTQSTTQEKLIKLSDACYDFSEYDHHCLQNKVKPSGCLLWLEEV